MNVRELIIELRSMPSEDPVGIWDEGQNRYIEVSGAFLALDVVHDGKWVEVL